MKGSRIEPPRPWSCSPLTTRQREILVLVRDGYADKQIGLKLGITRDTVKTHVKRIISRLEATNRTSAVIIAIRLGNIKLK